MLVSPMTAGVRGAQLPTITELKERLRAAQSGFRAAEDEQARLKAMGVRGATGLVKEKELRTVLETAAEEVVHSRAELDEVRQERKRREQNSPPRSCPGSTTR